MTDPLCLAVEKATAAGLVVVASAGNNGKDASGNEVLGERHDSWRRAQRDHRRRAGDLGHRHPR